MQAKGRFISALLIINAAFGGYAFGFNSRHVLIVDPSLPPIVAKEVKVEEHKTKTANTEVKEKTDNSEHEKKKKHEKHAHDKKHKTEKDAEPDIKTSGQPKKADADKLKSGKSSKKKKSKSDASNE